MAAGPPVVLFPSLAGSVLECEKSRVPNYEGKRIWMEVNSLVTSEKVPPIELSPSSGVTTMVSDPFVQHLGSYAALAQWCCYCLLPVVQWSAACALILQSCCSCCRRCSELSAGTAPLVVTCTAPLVVPALLPL